jgi:hypothetical protein
MRGLRKALDFFHREGQGGEKEVLVYFSDLMGNAATG